jgi:branched-chain amino acid transport system substrate-binding protein
VRASSSTFGWRKRVAGPESLWRPRVYVQSLLGLLGLLAGCKREPRVAVIGYAFPLWGTTTVQVARDEIASWPAGATPIRIVYDSIIQGDPPDIEVMRAQRLAQTPNLVAVVGHGGSRGSLAAAPIYAAAGIPQIVPTGTSRLLRQAGPWAFLLAPDDSTEGALIGRFTAERLGARRVLLFFTNDEYGVGLRDGVLAELAARDIVVLDKVGVDPSSDIPTLFEASLRRGIPDVIVVAGRHTETGRVARAAFGRVPRLRVVAGDGALLLPALADLAGPAADSIYVVAFWLADAPDSMSRAFIERYRRVAGHDPSPDDPMNHDALMLLAHAVRTVGPDRAAVRGYLESLGGTRPPYRGITGDITFRRARTLPLVMARLRGGRVVSVGGVPAP